MNKIYADNAATTKLSLSAFEEMKKYLIDDYSNPSQPYSFSKKSKLALKNARKMIAEYINASPEEIFYTSGGSESDNWAIKCFGLSNDERNIFTSEIEHHAVLNSCEAVNHSFVKLKVDTNGIVSKETLKKALAQEKEQVASCETSFVSIMMANNEIGTIEPIKELAQTAHKYGACFHTDAVQCVGHMKIDVKELDVDMLSASAHKFNGPKGIGFLYIKKGTILHQLINGGAQENGYRAGTENVASIVGMATALKENLDNLDANVKHITEVENAFVSKLIEYKIDFIRNGAEYQKMPGIVKISIKDSIGEMLLHW
jgi:cysteine desulfurase